MVQTRSQGNVVARKVYVNENDEMEVKVWDLRNEMVGMKNVNMEKKEKITKKIMKVLCELEEIGEVVMATEMMMDLLKFQWKFVLKGLMTLEAFKNEFDHVYEHIDCECGGCIPEWLQVQVSQFHQDFENLMANFMLCEKCEKFNKVLIELENVMVKACDYNCEDCGGEGMPPSILGMKVGKYTLLHSNPKTKDEYVQMIKYTLAKCELAKGNQKVSWALQGIEYGVNFVKDCGENESLQRFKETVIIKIKEFIAEPRLNENQKARLQFLLEQFEPKVIESEVPKWVQKQTDKFLKQFDIEAKNYQQATIVQKSESTLPATLVSPRIEQIKKEENDKCLIDYREMPIGKARSLEYAKTVFMKVNCK
jgi:hypothetical protein